MPLSLEDAKALVRTVVRTIDRKAEATVSLHEGDHPGFALNLSLRKHSTNIVIPVQDLEGAVDNTMRRSQLRTTIKRAIDRMTFEAPEIASTKMVRGPAVDGGFFRAQQGGGFRGGRR